MKSVNLVFGDCTDRMQEMSNNSIDLTVTSPPYDNLRTYNSSLVWDKLVWESVLTELWRITKDGGVVVWIVSDATVNGSESGSSFRQALFAIDCGFRLHDTMIWEKDGFVAVGALRTRYAPVFEYMFIFSKGRPKTFNPIKDRVNKSFGKKLTGTKRNSDGSFTKLTGAGIKIFNEFGQRFNVWRINKDMSRQDHPATFPINLVEDHIKSWSNKGDIVLDPFMGSGTTGVACINLERNFIGIEKDLVYFNLSDKRISACSILKLE